MKRIFTALLAAVTAIMLTGCGKAGDIRITSCDLVSVSPQGLKSINGTVAVGIHNPTFAFTVTDIHGAIYHLGSHMADFKADDVEVEKHSDGKTDVQGNVTLAPGTSILTALGLLRDLNPEDYTIDAYATVKAKGLHKKIERKGIKLSALMDAAKK